METFKQIVDNLIESKKYVATMESCTGGALASEITNNPGASQVLKFSAVTYSNEYKIKMGVDPEIIDEFSVYSAETAVDMAVKIAHFAHADYGIGITGKLNDPDPENEFGIDDQIFVAIYDKELDKIEQFKFYALNVPRSENKARIVSSIGENFLELLENKKKGPKKL